MIEWREIPNHENYEASNTGLIRRKTNQKVLRDTKQDYTRDYKIIALHTRGKRYTKIVSRLIWSAFKGCQCENTIDHIDRNPINNHIDNLRCITHKENSKNRDNYSNKTNKYNLDDEKKKHIITKLKSGEWTAWTVMKEYQIPMNYTHMIIKRGSWDKYLDESNSIPEATENSK
jgi:hypothetical protein